MRFKSSVRVRKNGARLSTKVVSKFLLCFIVMENALALKRTLFLGDLPIFCTEEDLYQLFSRFGDLYEVRLKRDQITNRSLSYGFIKFVTPISAEMARDQLDGHILHGRAIK